MKLELQAQLFSSFPLFFRRPRQLQGSNGSLVGPLDRWGIETGDGWFDLIEKLAVQHEENLKCMVSQGVPKRQWPRAMQVKEKFGTLRVYVRNLQHCPTQLIEATENATRESATVCEVCGRPGELRRAPAYIEVSCNACHNRSRQCSPFDGSEYQKQLDELGALLRSRSF